MTKIKHLRLEQVFLLLGGLFVGTSLLTMPVNAVPDELNHARMIWEILFKPGEASFDWYNSWPHPSQFDWSVFTQKIDLSQEVLQPQLNLKILDHLPQLFGMLLGRLIYPSVGVIVLLGRLMNGLSYLAGVYWLLKRLKFGKEVLFFVSLLPIMVQQAGSLSYDVANFLVIALFFTYFANRMVDRRMDKKGLIQLVLVSLVMYAAGKTNNLLLLAWLIFIPYDFLLNDKLTAVAKTSYTWLGRHWRWLLALAGLGLALLGLVAGTVLDINLLRAAQILFNTLFVNSRNEHLNSILTVGMFGFIGNFVEQLPLWLIFIDIVFLTLLLLQPSSAKVGKFPGLMSGLIFPVQVLVIVIGMYLAWTPVVLGEGADISVGAQGRYFTPFLLFFIPLFQSFTLKLNLKEGSTSLHLPMYVLLLLNFLVTESLIFLTYFA